MIISIIFSLFFILADGGAAGEETKDPFWSASADDRINSVDISADGQYIVAGSDDRHVYLYHMSSGTELWSYEVEGSGLWGVETVAISADGKYIVSGDWDSNIHLFHRDSNVTLWQYHAGDRINSIAISSNGEYIAAGSADKKVYLFQKDNATPIWTDTVGDNVAVVDISADGNYLIAGSDDRSCYFYKKGTSTPYWSHETGGEITSVSISCDGQNAVAGSRDGKVYLFERESSTPLWEHSTNGYPHSVDITSYAEHIVAGTSGGSLYLFQEDSSTPLWENETGSSIGCVAITPGDEFITIGCENNRVLLFETGSSTPLWSGTVKDKVDTVALSDDGLFIVAGSEENDARVHLFIEKHVPYATIVYSQSYAAVEGDNLSFEAQCIDQGSDITYVWSSHLDGELYNGTEATFYTTTISPGSHIITLRCMNESGVWTDPVTTTLTVNIKPEEPEGILIAFTSPGEGSYVNGLVNITGEASPLPDHEDAEIWITIDEGLWEQVLDVNFDTENPSNCTWKFLWNSTNYLTGPHTFNAKAYNGSAWSESAVLNLTMGTGDGPTLVPVPTWKVGDKWTWTFTIEFEGETSHFPVKEEVMAVNVTEGNNGTLLGEPCYEILSIIGPEGMGEERRAWLSMEDLEILDESGDEDVTSFYMFYYPGMFDWPLVITTRSSYSWVDAGDVKCDAGTFHCYKYRGSGDFIVYYSPEVGHFVKITEFGLEYELTGTTFSKENGGDDNELTIAGMNGYMVIGGAILLVVIVIGSVMVIGSRKGKAKPESKKSQKFTGRSITGADLMHGILPSPPSSTPGMQIPPGSRFPPPMSQSPQFPPSPVSSPGFPAGSPSSPVSSPGFPPSSPSSPVSSPGFPPSSPSSPVPTPPAPGGQYPPSPASGYSNSPVNQYPNTPPDQYPNSPQGEYPPSNQYFQQGQTAPPAQAPFPQQPSRVQPPSQPQPRQPRQPYQYPQSTPPPRSRQIPVQPGDPRFQTQPGTAGPPSQTNWLCPGCGNPVPASLSYCTNCGSRRA